ncbi:MAG: hypothetical protein R2911_28610 [Caldilineaceae bacterium]
MDDKLNRSPKISMDVTPRFSAFERSGRSGRICSGLWRPGAGSAGGRGWNCGPSSGRCRSRSPSAVEGLAEVARDKSLILMFQGGEGAFTDVGNAGMYSAGTTGHRAIPGGFEPLFYYSAFADELIPLVG